MPQFPTVSTDTLETTNVIVCYLDRLILTVDFIQIQNLKIDNAACM